MAGGEEADVLASVAVPNLDLVLRSRAGDGESRYDDGRREENDQDTAWWMRDVKAYSSVASTAFTGVWEGVEACCALQAVHQVPEIH